MWHLPREIFDSESLNKVRRLRKQRVSNPSFLQPRCQGEPPSLQMAEVLESLLLDQSPPQPPHSSDCASSISSFSGGRFDSSPTLWVGRLTTPSQGLDLQWWGMKVDPVLFGIPCFHISFISKYNIRTEKYTNHVRESERESESEVAQSCLTLCDPMDCSLPGSSVHGIFQARVLEWIAISFSRASSQPRDWTQVSRIVDRRFTVWATREVLTMCIAWWIFTNETFTGAPKLPVVPIHCQISLLIFDFMQRKSFVIYSLVFIFLGSIYLWASPMVLHVAMVHFHQCTIYCYKTMSQFGFSWWLSGKESTSQGRRYRRYGFHPRVGKILWRRTWQPTPVFLLGNPMDRGAWRTTVHGVTKESDMT